MARPIENNSKPSTRLTIDKKIYSKLLCITKHNGTSINYEIRLAIANYVNNHLVIINKEKNNK